MAIGDFFIAPVEHIAAGGAGVLRQGGKTIFMDMTAPGDRVRGRIIEEHQRWARGELEEILEPSPQRRTPPCPLYGRCGGCSLQHLEYETQLAEKSAIFKELLRRIGGIQEPSAFKTVGSPQFEYRNRVSLHCKGGKLGFKGRKSAELVPLGDCPVLEGGLRRRLREGRVKPPPDKSRFTCYSRGDCFLQEGVHREGRVRILGQELVMAPGVFFQSNGFMLEELLGELLSLAEQADPSLPMADIYCGVGTFGAFLQGRFSRIDMIEENQAALDLARKNMAGPGRFFALRDEQWVQTDTPQYGFVVVDPPRQGLSRGLGEWLIQKGPPCFAYISCDPATLARDSAHAAQGGYRLESISFYDFYPQTAHIEGLAFFKKSDFGKTL